MPKKTKKTKKSKTPVKKKAPAAQAPAEGET